MAAVQSPAVDASSSIAFAALLAAQMPALRMLARRFTRSAALAEDLVQDTAVRALTYQNRFAAGTNFRAWVSTVMTNTFLNRHRRTKRENVAMYTAERFDVMQNLRSETTRRQTREPEKFIMDKGFDDSVMRALANLQPVFREAIELCDIAGMSYKDASAHLQCPLGTVMSRLYRGRRELKQALQATGRDHGLGLKTRDTQAGRKISRQSQAPAAPRRRARAVLGA